MKKAVLLTFVLVALSLALIPKLPTSVEGHPANIIVPDDYEKIQWAIGNASDGDTIFVRADMYYEHVVINKSVSLIGVDRSTTIIDGGGVGTVVSVSANNVSISGFTIRNAGYQPIFGIGYWSGVLLTGSDNIISNNIVSNGDRGISLFGAKGNTIDNNTVSNNKWYGIDLYGSSENIISNNTVTSNSYGIYVGSNGNKVNNNTMSKNGVGICFEYAKRNTLRNNDLTDNNYGLKMGLGIGLEDFNQDIDTSNLINSKPICYLVKQENVIIDSSTFPNGVGYLGIVGSRNVTAKDFSISGGYQGVFLAHTTNSTVKNISVSNCYYGAHLFESTWNTVTGCSLSSSNGVYLEASNDNLISNNTMFNNGFGIELYFNVAGNILSENRISGPVFGIDSYTCYNNTVTENVVSNCSSGISLRGSRNVISENNVSYCEYGGVDVTLSNFTVISGNLLSYNGKGVWVHKSDYNMIFGNTLISNDRGFDVRYCTNNAFYRNNVVNNTIQANLVDTINKWDNGYPSGGNYWSDYEERYPNAEELDGSGIWNTSYVIDENNQDRYPLMRPWGDVEPPIANAGSNQTVFQGMTVTFNASGSTDDVAIKSYIWAFTDVTPKTLTGIQPQYTFNNSGNFEVTLNITDYAGKWDTDTAWIHVLKDTAKPSIGTVSQEPQVPDEWEKVTITVDVTDGESGVHNVTLSYSTNEGVAWTDVPMNKTTGDTYVGEIPGLPAGTNVTYKITAYDKAGNLKVEDNFGQYYVYTVIPEFPTWTSILLILIVLTGAITIYKRRLLKTPIH